MPASKKRPLERKSNRLQSVEDAVGLSNYIDAEDFQNRTSVSSEYAYDANGNVTLDYNSGYIIAYNHLNKPTSITQIGVNNTINMTYSADGTKLRQTTYTSGQAPQVMDYSTGYIYKQRELQYFAHEEGRCLRTSTSTPDAATPNVHLFRYEYNLTDHLGNVRISFSDTDNDGKAEVLQEQHYEAYGLRLGGLVFQDGEENRFTYSGKERIGELGLGWSDFGARMYNPAIGRWNGVDALAEKYLTYSPYNYVYGDPIKIKDIDGKEGIITVDENTITFSTTIHITGTGATAEKAAQMQAAIMKYWGKDDFRYDPWGLGDYKVNFDIKVVVSGTEKFKEGDNLVRLIDETNGEFRSKVFGDKIKGGWYGQFGNDESDATYAHEVGHFIGFADLYFEDYRGVEQRYECADKEDLMYDNHNPNAHVTQDDIDAFCAYLFAHKKIWEDKLVMKWAPSIIHEGLTPPVRNHEKYYKQATNEKQVKDLNKDLNESIDKKLNNVGIKR